MTKRGWGSIGCSYAKLLRMVFTATNIFILGVLVWAGAGRHFEVEDFVCWIIGFAASGLASSFFDGFAQWEDVTQKGDS